MSHTGGHSSCSGFEQFNCNKTNTISQLKLLSGLRTTVLFHLRTSICTVQIKTTAVNGVHLKLPHSKVQNCRSWTAKQLEFKGLAYFQSCNLNYFSKLPCSLLPFCARYLHCLVIIGRVSLLEFISRDLTLPLSGHNTTAFINPSVPVPRLAWWISSHYSSLVNIHKTELSASCISLFTSFIKTVCRIIKRD